MAQRNRQAVDAREPPDVTQAGDDTIASGAGSDMLRGGEGGDRLAGAARPASIDPSKTDVFQQGPDGKLHPIPGWHTTGPFDYGAWAHNIDWDGVARDTGHILAGMGTFSIPPVFGVPEMATLGSFYQLGEDTLKDLHKADEQSRADKTHNP